MAADETKCGRRFVRTSPMPENCSETNSNGDRISGGGVIFHRAREWPMPDPNDTPIKKIQFLLDRYRIKEALHIFFCDTTLRLLGEEPDFMWDIIPLICQRLRGLCQYRFRVFEGCERMLCRIAVEESCNPKEVLISLLSEISHSDNLGDDNVFRAMIRPLEGTLLRMNLPSPREKSFRWTLTVLMRHIYDIDLPQEYNIEGKRRLSLPNDPSVKRYIEVLPLMFNFIDEFNDKPLSFERSPMPILTESQIDEVLNGELVDDDDFMNNQTTMRCDITDASLTALLHLVGRPLAYLDLTIDCKQLKSTSVRCLIIILKLMPNLFASIYKRSLVGLWSPPSSLQECATSDSTSTSVTTLASNHFDGNEDETILTLATCAYIFRCCASYVSPSSTTLEMVPSFPQILSQETLLYCHTPYVVALLRRSEILVHEKGLILLENLLISIDLDTLDQKYLDLFRSSDLMQQLFHIMVFSPYCKNRRRAYDSFTKICDLLTHDCKLQMFNWVLSQTELKPCIRAACIDQYRKQLGIIQKKLIKYHQQLSFMTTLSTTAQAGGLNDSELPNKEQSSDSSSSEKNDILPQLIADQETTVSSAGSDTQIKSTDDIWSMSNDIMGQINLWQARYKVVGGQELVNFLNLCIEACLPETQHTDIIENYELLLATLTMFRYLRLRKTLFKDEIEDQYLCAKKLKKLLFDPVRSAIAMLTNELKSHHKEIAKGESSNIASKLEQIQVINEVAEAPPTGLTQVKKVDGVVSSMVNSKLATLPIVSDSEKEGCELRGLNNLITSASISSTITNNNSPSSDEPDEIECLNWVLCRLDLVDSVLVRTCDLYNC